MMNICSYISGRAWESQWQSSSEWWSWQSLIIKMMIIIVMMKICSYISGRAWESDGSWQLRLHLGLFHICPVSELLGSASSSLWSWWWWWKGAWGEGRGRGGPMVYDKWWVRNPPLMTCCMKDTNIRRWNPVLTLDLCSPVFPCRTGFICIQMVHLLSFFVAPVSPWLMFLFGKSFPVYKKAKRSLALRRNMKTNYFASSSLIEITKSKTEF